MLVEFTRNSHPYSFTFYIPSFGKKVCPVILCLYCPLASARLRLVQNNQNQYNNYKAPNPYSNIGDLNTVDKLIDCHQCQILYNLCYTTSSFCRPFLIRVINVLLDPNSVITAPIVLVEFFPRRMFSRLCLSVRFLLD